MSHIKYIEPSVDFGEAPALDIFGRGWSKLASRTFMPPEVEAFLKTAKPIPGHRLLLVHGLGSGEYWGPNRNGDNFPEFWKGAKSLIEDNPEKGYGFRTFEKQAHAFRDHRNHDPRLSIGGKVVLAVWNEKMHRVELIVPFSEKEAPDVVDAIDKGEKIAVSMGCRVDHDYCSICGNAAKTRRDYCKHASEEMGMVYPDGRKVYVDNPRPSFFDISALGDRGQGRPADASAFSLRKVASAQAIPMIRGADLPKLSGEKSSDINKQVPTSGEGMSNENGSVDIDTLTDLIRQVVPFDMDNAQRPNRMLVMRMRGFAGDKMAMALSTLTAAGIFLRPEEFDEIGFKDVPKISFDKVSSSLFMNLEPDMPERSMWLPFVGDRVYRAQKLGTCLASIPKNMAGYSQYISHVKEALTSRDSLMKLAAVFDQHFYLKSAIARNELNELQKFAAGGKGLSAENLVAALLGPMLAGAYFRSQQYSGAPIGPLRSLVANHPIATGAGTALLWHKLKGGKLPLIS